MEESIRLLLDEAKNGIMTVSDFYAPEILTYFYAKAIMGIIFGVILMFTIIAIFLCNKREWFWEEGWQDNSKDVSIGGILVIVFTAGFALTGVIVLCCNIYDLIMLSFAPKIFITEHLLHMF